MTNAEQKQLIQQFRDEGKSYKTISEIFKTKYGVIKSSQAIQQMYSRMQNSKRDNTSISIRVCDVVNIYALGYNMMQTYDIINSRFGYQISYSSISNILHANKKYYNSVIQAMKANISDNVDTDGNPLILKNRLEYKGVQVTEEKFKDIIYEVYSNKIKCKLAQLIVDAFRLTNDRDIIKRLCNDNITIDQSTFEHYLRTIDDKV